MQNFRTLGLIIKNLRDLVTLTHKYLKIIQCDHLEPDKNVGVRAASLLETAGHYF